MGCYFYGFRVWCLQELDGSYWLTLMTRICRLSELELWPHTQRFVKWIDIGLIFCLPTPIGWVVLTLASIYICVYIYVFTRYVYICIYIMCSTYICIPTSQPPTAAAYWSKLGHQMQVKSPYGQLWSWADDLIWDSTPPGGLEPFSFNPSEVWQSKSLKVLSQTLGHSDLASPSLEFLGYQFDLIPSQPPATRQTACKVEHSAERKQPKEHCCSPIPSPCFAGEIADSLRKHHLFGKCSTSWRMFKYSQQKKRKQ